MWARVAIGHLSITLTEHVHPTRHQDISEVNLRRETIRQTCPTSCVRGATGRGRGRVLLGGGDIQAQSCRMREQVQWGRERACQEQEQSEPGLE